MHGGIHYPKIMVASNDVSDVSHPMMFRITYKNSKLMFFQNCLAMLGICLGIITGHFEAIKKLKKIENFTFF